MLAIGRVAYTWNGLHESLAYLFWAVLKIENGVIPFSIWHSVGSDRTQREMLLAATKASGFAKATEDEIIWLLKHTLNLAENRNNALHAPIWVLTNLNGHVVEPNDLFLNPRAKKLRGKDLLIELEWYAATAETLMGFAHGIAHSISLSAQHSLPQRPLLPSLGQKSQKGSPRKKPPG